MLKDLTIEGLQFLDDGRVAVAINRELRRVIADCEDRPFEKKGRKVTIVLDVTPVTLQDGACVDVDVATDIGATIPRYRSRKITCRVKQGGRAVFNDLAPDNPLQRTLDEVD